MDSPGFNPLAVLAPDLYAKQLAIQRRQALAQSLLEQGQANMGSQPYGGLRSAGNAILGAYLAKRADKDTASLYATPQAQTPLSQQDVPEPQISNVAGTGPSTAPSSPSTPGGSPSPQALGAALQGSLPTPQASQPRTIPSVMNDAIPALPGLSKQQSMLEYFQSPSDYWKALAPTPEYRNALMAADGNPDAAKQLLLGAANKGASATLRPGGGSVNYATGQVITMPNTNGIQTQFPQGINGPASMSMVPGASQALAQSGYAQGASKALLTPQTAYDANNQPIASNQATMSGNAPAIAGLGLPVSSSPPQQGTPNIDRNNPWNVSPGGSVTQHSTPTAGLGQAWDTLGGYAKRGINTVSGIMNTWAPVKDASGRIINPSTPQNVQMIAKQLGVDPNQPINIADPEVRGKLMDLMRPTETGNRYGPNAQNSVLRPELPAGQSGYMQSIGKDASDRHDATVAAASESPMRMNVLDNIINLSAQGVATGPGQSWQNQVLGYAANTPLLSPLLGGAKDNVAKFQELQKFTYQNALRNWTAAGGTGTDAQMNAASHANPNDALFPQALQGIAKWAKASELAIQGKANAQDRFLAQNGQTPQSQISFENTWRNAFDPKVFQYSLMSPQEKQAFAATQLKTPQAAQAFIAKQKQLQTMGALQ